MGRVLRGLFVASGALLAVACAASLALRNCRRSASAVSRGCCSEKASASHSAPALLARTPGERPDFFEITRSRSKDPNPKWLLQGFGRFQCFLLFDTWQEAIDQANFTLEKLSAGERDLIQIAAASS